MQNTLEAEVRQLEYFIDNQFGHVNSIKAKQQENEYCIDRASRSAKKLTLINDAEISRLCGNDIELMQIFLRRLLPSIKNGRERLLATIPRLQNILWTYRRINQRTHLVQVMHNFSQAGRFFSGESLSDQSLAHSPFNLVAPLPVQSYADIENKIMRNDLINIVKSMRTNKYKTTVEDEEEHTKKRQINKEVNKTTEIPEPLLKPFLASFITALKQKPQSARKFWLAQPTRIVPTGIWIGWLHQQLQQNNHPKLTIKVQLETTPHYSANQVISDVIVSYQEPESEYF